MIIPTIQHDQHFYLIFCAYDETRTLRSFPTVGFLKALFKNTYSVFVSNSSIFTNTDLFDFYINGSNERREWSAYQEGLEFLDAQVDKNSIKGAIFIDDTIQTSGLTIIDFYSLYYRSISHSADQAVLIGKVDTANLRFNISNIDFSDWVSAHLFYASSKLLSLLYNNLISDEFDQLDNRPSHPVDADALKAAFFDSVDPNMKAHLDSWLFGGGWHGSQELNSDNYVFFRKKLRSILNEFHLSAVGKKYGTVESVRDIYPPSSLLNSYFEQNSIDIFPK